jgi:hypothetical protein
LSLDPRFADSNPAKDNEFSREIKIHSILYFVGELKPSTQCHKILWYVKKALLSTKEILCKAKFIISFPTFSCSATR